jgi:hypothetical protein
MSYPVHVIINETQTKSVLVKSFPCMECGCSISAKTVRINEKPVLHSIQSGKCPSCSAEHFVINGRDKADCIALEPVLVDFQNVLKARKI